MLKRPRTTLVCALAMLAPGCGEAPRELPDWAESVLAPARTRAGAGREAEVDVPPQANGAVHLVDARTALGVFVALDGARPIAGTERDGMTFYPGAVDDADYVIVERPDGFEDFLLYHDAPAEPVARWRIELENVAGLRLIGSTLELLDEGGAPRLRARRPYLIDAHGRRLPASLELEGCRADRDPRGPWERPVTPPGADRCVIAVRWGAGVAYPAVLDPWIATGTMVTPRTNERGVVLGDGRVLVTCSNALEDTAEIYDPSTGTWALTGELLTPRHFCAPVRLVDGRVLVAGGSSPDYFSNFKPLGDGEIYDPATGLFTATPKMSQPRSNPQAVVLGDGRVLLLGGTASDGYGQGCGSAPVTTEIFDPSLGWFVAGPQPQLPHCAAAAAALPDGGALLAGDFSTTITERYDLQSNTWSPHGELTSNGSASTAVVLSDGRVMLLGGFPVYGEPSVLDAAIFDPNAPAASAWSLASPMLHWQPTAVALADRVFAIGDDSSGVGGGFLDIYDVASDTWHVGDPLDEPISSVTALDEHSVLVTGGHAGLDGHDKAWVFALLPDGASCDDAIECISLHCVDGVCCDTACGEPCHACSARLKGGGGDGVCDLVQADAPDPRGACQDDGGCGQTGRCSASGSCALYEAGTRCTGAVCPAAQASCDGLGSCVCEAPRCSDDELTFDGRDCTPYRCNAQGCLTTCTGSEQCAPGFLCDRDAQCVLPAPEDAASCACRIASPASRSSSLLWLGLGGVLAFVRRRRSLTGVALVLGAALAACPSDVDPPPGSGGSTTAAIAGNGGGGAGGMEEGGHGGAGGAGGAAVGGHAGDGGRGGEGGAPMPTWTCLQTDYGTMNGCNCGCGIIDPDCADATVANCDYCGFDDYGTVYGTCAVGMCPGNVDPMNNATCLVPVCGNDIHDTGEECDDGNTAPKDGCDASCQLEPLPPGWTCGPPMGDPTCWCGCGAFDLRCADETAASCDFCPQQQGSCGDYMCVGIDPVDNKTCPTCGNGSIDVGEECDDANDAPGDGCANCHVTPPYHWTCSSAYYAAADGCDCGCGAFDPDCPDGNAASCDYCTDPGGCGTGLCPANIAPSDNATCAACGNGTLDTGEQCDDANTVPYDGCSPLCRVELYPPPAWSCVLSYYNAGDGCDCGCGVVDPDCADATVGSCAYCRPNGSCGNAACPANIDPIDNASCL